MSTVAQEITAVNWYVATDPDTGNGPDLAYRWGHEDATEGNDTQGSAYFPIESPAWHSYNEGYAAGLLVRKQLAPPSELDEIEFMSQALDTLRAEPFPEGAQPKVYVQAAAFLCDTDATEDDMEEWIGAAFSTAPYMW